MNFPISKYIETTDNGEQLNFKIKEIALTDLESTDKIYALTEKGVVDITSLISNITTNPEDTTTGGD